MEISTQIRQAREQKHLTQEAAAEGIGVSRQTISNWENGRTLPDVISLIRMSDLYGLTVDELLKGDPAMVQKIEKDEKESASLKRFTTAYVIIMAVILAVFMVSRFIGGDMKDFVDGALPYVMMGMFLLYAVAVPSGGSHEKKPAEKESSDEDPAGREKS